MQPLAERSPRLTDFGSQLRPQQNPARPSHFRMLCKGRLRERGPVQRYHGPAAPDLKTSTTPTRFSLSLPSSWCFAFKPNFRLSFWHICQRLSFSRESTFTHFGSQSQVLVTRIFLCHILFLYFAICIPNQSCKTFSDCQDEDILCPPGSRSPPCLSGPHCVYRLLR
jgi:hypothetical protein